MKVPKSDFKIFKKEFIRIATLLGLTHYRYDFIFEPLDDAYAQLRTNLDNKVVSIVLTTKLRDTPQPSYSPESCALHEALHLLLADYCALAEFRYAAKIELFEEEERVVRRLEKVLKEI